MRKLLLAGLLALFAMSATPAFGAATVLEVATADTTTSPNTSGAFTPASNDLLLVCASGSATNDTGSTLVSSIGGFTFTRLTQQGTWPGTITNRVVWFVADALVSSATSQTVTLDFPGDQSTGTNIVVVAVSGMTLAGTSAILQEGAPDNDNSAGATPTVVFGSNVNTSNVTLGCVANTTNPATVTNPTNWTELADIGYATPDHGLEVVHRDSGFTSTTMTWGSTYGSAGAAIAIELDTSAGEATPGAFDSNPSCSALDDDDMRCAVDAGTNTLTIKYCVKKKDASTPADGAAVETCSGGVTSGSANATGSSQNIDINISGDQYPIYDFYFAAKNTTLYGSVANQLDEVFSNPSGRQYVAKSGSPGVGEEGLFDGASPAIADGDYMDACSATDSFAQGAAAHTLTLNADTTFSVATGGDTSRQICTRRFYDVSVADWSDASPVAYVMNDVAPVYIGAGEYLFEEDITVALPLDGEWEDAEADAMTHAIANNPAGGALSDQENLSGAYTTCGRYATPQLTATDAYSEATNQTVTIEVGKAVPDVIDVSEATAISTIEALCSLNAVAGNATFSETIAAGNVISVSPDVGELVEYDGTVTYTLSLGASTPATERRVVYVLASLTGLTRWVDYIPVGEVPGCEAGRHDENGCWATLALASNSGKTAWIDYIPVGVVSQTANKWRYENDGWIPVDDLTP